jgi:hypothetical protein
MNIYLISDNIYKKDIVEKVFQKRYKNFTHEIILTKPTIPSIQCFEEEVEHYAYLRIQGFLQNKDYLKKPDDVIVGIQTGLMKNDDMNYEEITFVMIYYLRRIYSIESKRIKISEIYHSNIYDSQINREKIFCIYEQIGFENRRKEVIEETLQELLDKMFE